MSTKEEIFKKLRYAGFKDSEIKKEYKKSRKILGSLVSKSKVAEVVAANLGVSLKGAVRDEEEYDATDGVTHKFTEAQIEILMQAHNILGSVLKGRVEQFKSKCKYCGKEILMQRMVGENWKPMNPNTGNRHTCKESRKHFEMMKQQNKAKGKYQREDY